MSELLMLPPDAFAERLLATGSSRVMLLGGNPGERPRASQPEFEALADFFASDQRDYRDHEAVVP